MDKMVLLHNVSQSELADLCSDLLSEKTSEPVHIIASSRPDAFTVWALGLSFVTFISISAVIGILFMRCMSKSLFNRFITFFVAVGVGSLSGSSIFHLLPQAFGLVQEFDVNANHSYLVKSFAAVCGIYLFFIADKLIKVFLEAQKRCKKDYELKIVADQRLDSRNQGTENSGSHSRRSSESLILRASERKPDALIAADDTSDEQMHQAHSICIHDHDMVYNTGDSVIATVAWMIIFGDGLHNFIDGVSIGASFSESVLSGLSVSVAVICEEFPHELGDVAILVSAGMSLRQALVYNLLSALTCYVGFVIGVIFGNLSDEFTAYIFAFAGGMFLYISIGCMMPEMKIAMENALTISVRKALKVLLLQLIGVFTGLSIMLVMARYGGEISFGA